MPRAQAAVGVLVPWHHPWGVVIDHSATQTKVVVDLREPGGVVLQLDDARRRFEKGGPTPVAVRDLLVKLADELADSGPLELGVSPRRWLRARDAASRAVARLQSDGMAGQSAATVGVRELRRIFTRAARAARWRAHGLSSPRSWVVLFASIYLVLFCATYLAVSLAHGSFAARWLAPGVTLPLVAMMLSVWFWLPRLQLALELHTALATAAMLAPEERPLFGARLRSGRRFAIATDRRVVLVQRRPRDSAIDLDWSLPYARITSFTTQRKGRGDKAPTCVILNAGSQGYEIDLRGEGYQLAHDKGLLAILGRRVETARPGSTRSGGVP